MSVYHHLRRRFQIKRESGRLDSAVLNGEYPERPVDYIHDNVESIIGIERLMSEVEVGSYRRFGQLYGFPEFDIERKIPFDIWLGLDEEEEYEKEWNLFFEEPCSYQSMPRGMPGRKDSRSWCGFKAVYHDGQDTGMRLFESRHFTRGQWLENATLFRISDCTLFNQPTYNNHAIGPQVRDPSNLIALGLFHDDRWKIMECRDNFK